MRQLSFCSMAVHPDCSSKNECQGQKSFTWEEYAALTANVCCPVKSCMELEIIQLAHCPLMKGHTLLFLSESFF